MKRYSLTILAFLLLVSLPFFAPTMSRGEVHFKSMTFAEAEKLAAKEKKEVMVDFYTDWCGWCKVLDRQTYYDRKVGEYADEHFIAIKVDAEKGDGIALAKKYGVNAFPTIIFYGADGKILNKVVGYQDTAAFARSMSAAVAGGLTGLLEKTTGKKGATDAMAWLTLAQYYSGHDNDAEALKAYEKVMQLDPKNEKKLLEQAVYGKGFASDTNHKYTILEDAYHQYPERPEARNAFMILMMHDFSSPEPTRALQRMDEWAQKHGMDADAFNAFAWEAAQHNIALPNAEEYATRAMLTYTEVDDRANALDTKAVIVGKEGRPQDALIYEKEAIAILPAGTSAKRMKEFTDRVAEFQKAVSANGGGTTTLDAK